ncbi:hypothetical protein GCM10010441_25420 [Kitasatospora paracochleata]|uniref:DUF7919 domain-containing protein n=1 Tax=Kitasatospora paracochleata TaxID=58354 RepID=A0ABT1J1R7_9ACTN|nr:hypothetical protein [Kitasatospora paracochleata]MCP2311099.1 hypothetical protein [Kitasatospora paracochleata]
MVHFTDLSPYGDGPELVATAHGYLRFTPGYVRLCVGWLGSTCSAGPVDRAFADALHEVVTHAARFNATRGFHRCRLCPQSAVPDVPAGTMGTPADIRANAEIRVPGRADTVFAAPTTIWHYVTAHGYVPPAEFQAAVLALVASGGHHGTPDWIAAWIGADAYRFPG